jgi:cobaltochelatase CobS
MASTPVSREEELINVIRSKIKETQASGLSDLPETPTIQTNTDPDFGVPIDERVALSKFDKGDWSPLVQARIPKVSEYSFNKAYLNSVLFAMKAGGTGLVWGPTGTGKTSLLREIAARKNIPFFRTPCHEQMESSEFLGTMGVVNDNGVPVTRHTDTDTTLVMQHGGMYVVDEAFRSPILMAIQSMLEYPPTLVLSDQDGMQRELSPTKPLWIFLTDNTNGTGDTTGKYIAKVQDLSTLDRVAHSIYMDYMTPDEELSILSAVYGEDAANLRPLFIKAVNLVRVAFKEGKLLQTMSIRAVLNWWRYYTMTGDISTSFRHAFWDKLGPDCKVIANNCYRQVFNKDVV